MALGKDQGERHAAPQRPPAQEQSQERHKSARPTVFATITTETRKCIICKGSHHIESCQQFQNRPPEKRASSVKEHLLCFSCLTQGHQAKDCQKKMTSQIDECKGKHHPLLYGAPRVLSSNAPFTGTILPLSSLSLVNRYFSNSIAFAYGISKNHSI